MLTLKSGTIFGCSSKYRSTSSSDSPSNMLILSAYSGVTSLLVVARGCVAMRTLVFPHRKVIIFFCQFYLICAVTSHSCPSSRGYAPCTFSCNTKTDLRRACPPIVTSRSRISPVGRTELVSAIHNQKGHGSHSWMPRVSHVCLLMTFTPDPLSIIVPAISLPFTITVIVGLLLSGLEKNVGVGAGFGLMTVAWRSAVNRGTNWSRRANGSTIWHSCSACHVGLSSGCVTASSSCVFWFVMSAMFWSLAQQTRLMTLVIMQVIIPNGLEVKGDIFFCSLQRGRCSALQSCWQL